MKLRAYGETETSDVELHQGILRFDEGEERLEDFCASLVALLVEEMMFVQSIVKIDRDPIEFIELTL